MTATLTEPPTETARPEQRNRVLRRRIAAGLVALAVVGSVTAVAVVVGDQDGDDTATKHATSSLLRLADAPPEEAARLVEEALTTTPPAIPAGLTTERPDTFGKAYDPPTSAEFGYALGLAVGAQSTTGRRVDGSPGYEFLSVDVAPGVQAGERRLMVTSFDYESNELVSHTVDLLAGTVTEERGAGLSAPPSDRESLFAMDLLVKSQEAARARAAFQRMTGEVLTSPAQLRFTGTSNIPGGVEFVAPKCATNRCVTFQGRAHDGAWLHLNELVVDLSDKTVYSVS